MVCILGARKGSKRLPKKNRMIVGSKTLYQNAIDAAIASGVFSSAIFSTDDEDIIRELQDDERIVLDRRDPALAEDEVPMSKVGQSLLVKHASLFASSEYICFLNVCNPFRKSRHIIEAVDRIEKNGSTSLISVTPYPFPSELSLNMRDGVIERNWSGPARKAQHTVRYYPNGAIVIVKKKLFEKTGEYFYPDTIGYVIEWPESIDIDDPGDYTLAQRLFPLLSLDV